MIWQPEFTDKTLSRKTGAVQDCIAGVLVRGLAHMRMLNRGGEREVKKTRRRGRVFLGYQRVNPRVSGMEWQHSCGIIK